VRPLLDDELAMPTKNGVGRDDSVLLAQILNRGLPVLIDPTSENRDEELPWLKDLNHAILRPPSGRPIYF
jgi:hypothetical protein